METRSKKILFLKYFALSRVPVAKQSCVSICHKKIKTLLKSNSSINAANPNKELEALLKLCKTVVIKIEPLKLSELKKS